MKVFVTGASGFVGSATVQELLNAGNQVVGLARSEKAAHKLKAAGAEVLQGSLEDLEVLKMGAAGADGVIHLAFIHDFSQFEMAAQKDKEAIEAIGAALAGTGKPFLATGGMAGMKPGPGGLVTEDDAAPPVPRASEATVLSLGEEGVAASVVRLPPSVHGKEDKHGFVPTLIRIAREKGVSAYVGDGSNRWPAVHVLDAALLYRLALEKSMGGRRYNAIGDEGVPVKEIAATIGEKLNLPVQSIPQEQAMNHFGWMGRFITINSPSSAAKTQEWLGWQPTHPGLIADMNEHYFEVN